MVQLYKNGIPESVYTGLYEGPMPVIPMGDVLFRLNPKEVGQRAREGDRSGLYLATNYLLEGTRRAQAEGDASAPLPVQVLKHAASLLIPWLDYLPKKDKEKALKVLQPS